MSENRVHNRSSIQHLLRSNDTIAIFEFKLKLKPQHQCPNAMGPLNFPQINIFYSRLALKEAGYSLA